MSAATAEEAKVPDRKCFTVWLGEEERQRLAEYAVKHDLRSSQVVRSLIRRLPDSATDDGGQE